MKWTAEDLKLLEELWPHMSGHEIAEKLGRRFDAVRKRAYKMGLKKSPKYLREMGQANRKGKRCE